MLDRDRFYSIPECRLIPRIRPIRRIYFCANRAFSRLTSGLIAAHAPPPQPVDLRANQVRQTSQRTAPATTPSATGVCQASRDVAAKGTKERAMRASRTRKVNLS